MAKAKPTAKSSFTSKLGKLAKGWKAAQGREPAQGGSNLEDGIYILQVTGCELGESQASSRLQVAWEFTVTDGEQKGEKVRDYDGLESEENLYWFQQKVARLGYDIPDSPEAIADLVKEIEKDGPVFRGRVKTKDEYQHVYINKLVEEEGAGEGEGEEEAPAAEEEEAAADEAPFAEGDTVSFKSKGKEVQAKVLEVLADEELLRVETEDGKRFRIKFAQATKVEAEEAAEEEEVAEEEEAAEDGDEFEVKVGTKIQWKYKGKTRKGKVTEILEKGVRAKGDDGLVHLVDDGDYEPAK